MKSKSIFIVSLIASLFSAGVVFATTGFVGSQGVWISDTDVFAGDTVKVFTVVVNNEAHRLAADAVFYQNNNRIGRASISGLSFEQAKQVSLPIMLVEGQNIFSVRLENIVATDEAGAHRSLLAQSLGSTEVSGSYEFDADTDGDDIGNKEDSDDDNDGILDVDERSRGTDPRLADTDGDSYDDAIDLFPTNSNEWADADSDGIGDNEDSDDDNDGLSDADEKKFGSDPHNADTDGDGLKDGDERQRGSSPTSGDSDNDGLSDTEEVRFGSNPTRRDSDNDGLSDDVENRRGTDPQSADTDSDGVEDGDEVAAGTDPLKSDTDGDGVDDLLDAFPLNPDESADTDLDGIGNNEDEDDDNDGLSDEQEAELGTDPLRADTDGDGVSDKDEIDQGTDPGLAQGQLDELEKEYIVTPMQERRQMRRKLLLWALFTLLISCAFAGLYFARRARELES